MAENRPRRRKPGHTGKIAKKDAGRHQVLKTEREQQALELRLSGMSFDAIAKEMGFKSRQSAHNYVEEALRKTIQEPADKVRKQELERLDRMQYAIWEKVKAGDTDAIRTLEKLMERRSKYLGLDAPAKQAFTSPDGEEDHGKRLAERAARDVATQDALFAELTKAMAGVQQHTGDADEAT